MARIKSTKERAISVTKSLVFTRICTKELTNEHISEIEKIIIYLNTGTSESGSTTERIAKIINETDDIFNTFVKLYNLKPHTLDWNVALYGTEKGTQLYNNRNCKLKKPREYSDNDLIIAFFKLKCIQENCKDFSITDNIIKILLEFNKKYKIMLISDEDKQKVVDILKFHSGDDIIKRYEILKSNPPYSSEYRNARYSNEENKKRKEERIINAKRNFPNCTEYSGYADFNESDIYNLRVNIQKERSLLVKKKVSPNQISYWIRKGYTKEEARLAVKERQTTFTLEKCIEKLGVEAGTARWKERQDKWQETLNNKTPEELDAINKSKGRTKDQLIEKFGLRKADNIIKERCKNRENSSSKESELFFREVDSLHPELFNKSITFYKNFTEFAIFDENNENIYFVDYIYNNKIIEYDGSYWHGDERLFENSREMHPSINCSIEDIRNKDNIRYNNLIKLGYDVLRLWSYDVINDKENSLMLVKKFLGLE